MIDGCCMSNPSPPTTLTGIGVSAGVAIGQVHLVERGIPDAPEYCVTGPHLEAERRRFLAGLGRAQRELTAVRDELAGDSRNKELIPILEAHRMMLADSRLSDGVMAFIDRERCNAEWAVRQYLTKAVRVFTRMRDPYLRARRQDIEQVGRRVLDHLMGNRYDSFSTFPHPVILAAENFSPADTLLMKNDRVLGFVTALGGRASHTAIMARALGIPAVVGVVGLLERICSGDAVAVDGTRGLAAINPTGDALAALRARQQGFLDFRNRMLAELAQPAETRDGRRILLKANIEMVDEAAEAARLGADGVGLYRTEYQYMNRLEPPGEADLAALYRNAIEAFDGQAVTIRTMDLGADKGPSPFHDPGARPPPNPALGLRGTRLCLRRERAAFQTQLRAILRASTAGPTRILLPLISGVEELNEALALLAEVKAGMRGEGVPFDEGTEVGIMIEAPSAALCAEQLAGLVDFFSIGANDLIQFALAVDRVDESVAHLYQSTHPAVLRLIRMTVEGARVAGIPVSLCGEMAGDPRCAILLVGLGLDELSVTPRCLPLIRKVIRGVDAEQARQAAEEALTGRRAAGADPLEALIREILGPETWLPGPTH